MSITVYSVLMALLWFSVFTVIFSFLMRYNWFVGAFNIWTLVILVALCIFRAIVPIELPGAIVLRSYTIFGVIRDGLYFKVFTIAGLDVTVLGILLTIWALGSLFLLVRLARRYIGFDLKIRKLPESNDEELARIVKEICHTDREIKIIKAKSITTPMVTGLTVPVILFPEVIISKEAVVNVILHEWNHYLHKDMWIKMFTKIICYLMWWNPLVYLLESNLSHILEIKCDRDVVAMIPDGERGGYFRSILEVYYATHKKGNAKAPPYSAGFARTRYERQIIQRFTIGMDPPEIKHKRLAYGALITAVVISFAISYLFIIQPASFPDEPLEEGSSELFMTTPENSYLVDNGDGTYAIYTDGMYLGDIPSIDTEPYTQLEITDGNVK